MIKWNNFSQSRSGDPLGWIWGQIGLKQVQVGGLLHHAGLRINLRGELW